MVLTAGFDWVTPVVAAAPFGDAATGVSAAARTGEASTVAIVTARRAAAKVLAARAGRGWRDGACRQLK
jgi:hypothetical protein